MILRLEAEALGSPAGRRNRSSCTAGPSRCLRGCRQFRQGADSCRRGGDTPTNASKLPRPSGAVASRSGTPSAKKRTKALIPCDCGRSAIPRRGRLQGPASRDPPAGSNRSRDPRRNVSFGGDLRIRPRLTRQRRLIDSKCRKRLKKRGVRRSLQRSPKRPVGSLPRVLRSANRSRKGLCGAGGRLLCGSTLNPDPLASKARSAMASCRAHPLPRRSSAARARLSFPDARARAVAA